jgi:predicted porin
MQAKLIALTLAALPATALADATIYGTLQAGIERDSITNGATNSGVQDYVSSLGIRGTESIGNGLKALWQVETRLNIDGKGSEALGSRDTFVGLSHDKLGIVRLGYLSTALNDLYQVDQWTYNNQITQANGSDVQNRNTPTANAGANGLAVLSNPGNRLKNAVRYDTPQLAGFSGVLSYGFGENKSQAANPAQSVKRASDIVSAGANYTLGNYFANYAYQREFNPNGLTRTGQPIQQTGSTISTADIHYAQAGFRDENLFVALGFQRAQGYDWTDSFSGDTGVNYGTLAAPQSAAQAKLTTRQAALSVAYTYQAITPKFSYAKGWNQQVMGRSVDNSGYQQFVVGVDYKLSKRTTTGLSHGRLTFGENAAAAVNHQRTTLNTTAVLLSHSF